MADSRAFSATTPLAPEKLMFGQMEGFDEIGQCFRYDLSLVSEDVDIDAKDVLGKPMAVHVGRDEAVRHFHGVVADFALTGMLDGYAHYRATLRPWLWFLSQTTDNRIFQNVSVVEIIEELLGNIAELTFEKRLQGSYPPRVYCVQYGESDLSFIQRLMEHEGMFYFFEHSEDGHVLVLADDSSQLGPVPGFETVNYDPDTSLGFEDGDLITRWVTKSSVVQGIMSQTEYDFEKPSADLTAKSEDPVGHDQDGAEVYHYPGNYTELSRGDALTAIRLEELQAPRIRTDAGGTVRGLWSGASFALAEFPRAVENTDHIVLRAEYRMWDDQYRSGLDRVETGFEVSLQVAPQAIPFRPERRTPKPRMKGPQTATVTGPAGAEIYTDEYSRVKVQFHWDREGERDENTTMFVRVSSVWAGAGWGFIQIPRIGQEVIIDFFEGDPDQPAVVGRLYNAEQMPPYGLPGNETQSGWKSNSSPGGGGFNELRFEDKAGSEEVYFQAQKDHTELVKNDEMRTIGHDFGEDVGNDARQGIKHDRTEWVGNDKTVTVDKNRRVHIGINDTENVDNDRSLTVGNSEDISIGTDSSETIGRFHSQTVKAAQKLLVIAGRSRQVGLAEAVTVGAWQTITVGLRRDMKVGGSSLRYTQSNDKYEVKGNHDLIVHKNHGMKVDGDQSLTLKGNQSYDVTGGRLVKVKKGQTHDVTEDVWIKAGKKMMLEAADEITLKCGEASIVLKKDGTIATSGKDVSVQASGDISNKADGDLKNKASKIHDN